MAKPTDTRAVIAVQTWPGLTTNSGPMGGPEPGTAQEQVNLATNVPGELAARPGFTKVTFDTE